MLKEIEYKLPPNIAFDEAALHRFVTRKHGEGINEKNYRLLKRSVDARGKNVKVNVKILIASGSELPPLLNYNKDFKQVEKAEPVVIVGCGPAGMFAALKLLELGYKPIIVERGGDVRARRSRVCLRAREESEKGDAHEARLRARRLREKPRRSPP